MMTTYAQLLADVPSHETCPAAIAAGVCSAGACCAQLLLVLLTWRQQKRQCKVCRQCCLPLTWQASLTQHLSHLLKTQQQQPWLRVACSLQAHLVQCQLVWWLLAFWHP
jgi:hypothetical protein